MSEKQSENSKTIRVTAESGVTGRLWFPDYGGNTGITGVMAKSIEVFNAEDPTDPASSDARIDVNLLEGNIDNTKSRLIRPGGSQSRDVNARCIAYTGIGGDAVLEITYSW